jgi:hypothetical protein
MSLKHNLAIIILGLFLIKIGIIDNARNYHGTDDKKLVAGRMSDRGIR